MAVDQNPLMEPVGPANEPEANALPELNPEPAPVNEIERPPSTAATSATRESAAYPLNA
jgi:hypothetical protein